MPDIELISRSDLINGILNGTITKHDRHSGPAAIVASRGRARTMSLFLPEVVGYFLEQNEYGVEQELEYLTSIAKESNSDQTRILAMDRIRSISEKSLQLSGDFVELTKEEMVEDSEGNKIKAIQKGTIMSGHRSLAHEVIIEQNTQKEISNESQLRNGSRSIKPDGPPNGHIAGPRPNPNIESPTEIGPTEGPSEPQSHIGRIPSDSTPPLVRSNRGDQGSPTKGVGRASGETSSGGSGSSPVDASTDEAIRCSSTERTPSGGIPVLRGDDSSREERAPGTTEEEREGDEGCDGNGDPIPHTSEQDRLDAFGHRPPTENVGGGIAGTAYLHGYTTYAQTDSNPE